MFNSKLSNALRGNKNAAGKRIGSAVQSLKIKASGVKNTLSEAATGAGINMRSKIAENKPKVQAAVAATKGMAKAAANKAVDKIGAGVASARKAGNAGLAVAKQKAGEVGANVGNKASIAKSAIKGDKAGLAKAKTMNSTFSSNMKARDEAIKRNKPKK